MLSDLRRERKKLEYTKAGYVTTATAAPALKKRSAKFGIGIATVIILIALVLIFNPFKQKIASPKEKSIAVMYFENRSDEKDLDKILVDMLITNLGRNKEISVISGQRLYDILKNMGKQDLSVIDKSTATEVAKQAGVQTMLLGTIWKVGEQYSVPAQLMDVESGAILNSDRIEAGARSQSVFEIADRLTEKVNEWLKVSQVETVRIADAMTSSYEAYRYYQKGMWYFYRYEFDSASIDFQQAIRIDTTFALAYLQLSMIQAVFDVLNMIPSQGLTDARETIAKAKRFTKNLPEKDVKFIEAWSAYVYRDFPRSDTLFGRIVSQYPQEKYAWLWLSAMDMLLAKPTESIRESEKVLELDRSSEVTYNSLAYVYCMMGEYEKAFSTISTYVALVPDTWNPYDSACEIYEMAGKLDEALKILEEGHKRVPIGDSYYPERIEIYLLMGEHEKAREEIQQYSAIAKLSPESVNGYILCIYMLEGRINEAVDLLRRGAQRLSGQNNKSGERGQRFVLGRILMEQGKFQQALEELRKVKTISEEVNRGTFNPWQFVVEYYSGLCNLRSGEIKQAEANADNLESFIQQQNEPFYSFLYQGLIADIELTKGKIKESLSSMEKMQPWSRTRFPRNRILQARIYTDLGDRAKAISLYDETYNYIISRDASMGGGPSMDFYIERSKLDYYKAQMYQHFNDKPNAIKFYEKAISDWRNGDKDYVNLVDAKAQLAKLKGGGR